MKRTDITLFYSYDKIILTEYPLTHMHMQSHTFVHAHKFTRTRIKWMLALMHTQETTHSSHLNHSTVTESDRCWAHERLLLL